VYFCFSPSPQPLSHCVGEGLAPKDQLGLSALILLFVMQRVMQAGILNRLLLRIKDGNIESVKLRLLQEFGSHLCPFIVADYDHRDIGIGR